MTTKSRVSTFPRNRVDQSSKIDNSVYQSTINTTPFNQLYKVKTSDYIVDPITGTATFQHKHIILRIPNFQNLSIKGISPTALYLLNALIMEFSFIGGKSKIIILPVKKYMELRGLTDKKEIIKQIAKDLELLKLYSITYQKEENKNKKKCDENFFDINLCQGKGIIKSKDILFHLSDFLYNHLANGYIMPINPALFKLNPRTSSFSLGYRLHSHHNMNYGKKNANIISVRNLLEACPTIPTREKAYPHLSQRIIEPFERDMAALEYYISWEYCNLKGVPLTDAQLGQLKNYETFKDSYVYFTIIDYPLKDVTQRKRTKKIKRGSKRKSQIFPKIFK